MPSRIGYWPETLHSAINTRFHNVDLTSEQATVSNEFGIFRWEYLWHCHLLGHEENIFMRSCGP